MNLADLGEVNDRAKHVTTRLQSVIPAIFSAPQGEAGTLGDGIPDCHHVPPLILGLVERFIRGAQEGLLGTSWLRH